MSVGTQVSRYPYMQRNVYTKKDGTQTVTYRKNYVSYRKKLHHPDQAEMEEIHSELARGDLRKDIAPRHQLTERRLRAHLAKYPPGCFAERPPPLSDDEVEDLLAEYLPDE